jgi:hypothetical protein
MNHPPDPLGWGRDWCPSCEAHHDPWEMAPRDPFSPQERLCLVCTRRDERAAYRSRFYATGRKPCDECGERLPFDAFYNDGRARDGLEAICKPCKKQRRAKRDAQRDASAELTEREEMLRQIEREGTRTCEGRCKRTKPLEAFQKRSDGLGGRRAVCKDCRSVEKRLRRLKQKRARAEARGLIECWLCGGYFPPTHVVQVDEESHECHGCHQPLDG